MKKNINSLEIRVSLQEDARALLQLLEILAEESENLNMIPGRIDKTVESEIQLINSRRENPKSNHLLALVDNKIVGMCGLNGRDNSSRISHRATLGIGILKEYCGIGIGYKLMSKQIDYAKSFGISKINLEVRINNETAINLYKKCGFEIEGTIRKAMVVSTGYADTYIMGLVL
ncbi:GNAT family protein [Mycoplasmatota bacterium WC44]